MEDPRWQRPARDAAAAAPDSPARNEQLQRVQRQHGPPTSSPSFNQKDAGYSIVFSASWVTVTTPIGEGAFSRVYEGVYKNPETGDRSIVAVKVGGSSSPPFTSGARSTQSVRNRRC